MPYFQDWLFNKSYPDGRGLYYQPARLVQAYETLLIIYNKHHSKGKE